MNDEYLRLLLEISQYNAVQKIGRDQHNNFGSIPRPYRKMAAEELKIVLQRITRATSVERRKIFAFRTAASMLVGYLLLTMADKVPSQIQPADAWFWISSMVVVSILAWAIAFRFNPFGETVEDWIATVDELRLQRRVVLAEIALRRVEGRWPSHTEEIREFIFGSRTDGAIKK